MDYKDYLIQKNKENHFWYESRKFLIDRLFFYYSKRLKGDIDILDIGCGTGTELKTMAKYGNLNALDINENAVRIAQDNGFNTIVSDIEKEKLEKEKYDIISAFDVLEHINDDYFALSNIYQALKEDGVFLFTLPAHQIIFAQHDIAMEHKRRYSKKGLKEKLKEEGFKNIELYYWNFTLFPLVFIIRMFKKIFIKKSTLSSEAKTRNKFINKILYIILKLEVKYCFRKKTLPGLSIYGVAKK